MIIVKRNTRQFKEFENEDTSIMVSGWKDLVELEFISPGSTHKLSIEMRLEKARTLYRDLGEVLARIDRRADFAEEPPEPPESPLATG